MDLIKVSVGKGSQPLAVLITTAFVRDHVATTVEWASSTAIQVDSDVSVSGNVSVIRFLARLAPASGLYGYTPLQASKIDEWLEFSIISCGSQSQAAVGSALDAVNTAISQKAFLAGNSVSLADIAVWSAIRVNDDLMKALDAYPKASVWYRQCSKLEAFVEGVSNLPVQEEPAAKAEDQGKFVELQGASDGNVVVRFPPEASGYLHIGHAKAALLNQYYQQKFSGKLIMRFDDTNPVKEKADFEEVILDDLKMLKVDYDLFSRTSDHFDYILECAEGIIKKRLAYVDDTPQEQMQKEREQRIPSRNRENTVEKNLQLWEDMKAGNETGLQCCLRAKIDYASDNGCLRDPTLFRCKLEPHVQTGTKYKAYPTYDFACPIVDSIEGVTHALRTMEYHDRDEQYYWLLDAMGLRKPHIWEYSRLNLQHTVLSKRKLTWFVEEGLVDGWDDPRFPTVRGVMRKGMTVEGLRQFIIAQGSSKANVTMEWDKIWAFNRKVIDPIAARYSAVVKERSVEVNVKGFAGKEFKHVPKHPKFPEGDQKEVWYSAVILVDGDDAVTFSEGETVTFMHWGNAVVERVVSNDDGVVTAVDVQLKPDDTNYKNTTKVTWLAKLEKAPLIPITCAYYDDIISKPVLAKEDNFKDYINQNSKAVVDMYGESLLGSLKKGDIVQLQRKGFFICDQPYAPASIHTSVEAPCVLIAVPDGRSKALLTSGSKAKRSEASVTSGESADSQRGSSKKAKQAPKLETIAAEPTLVGAGAADVGVLRARITECGDRVRELKTSGAAKEVVDAEVKVLLELKKQLKDLTGEDLASGGSGKKKGKAKADKQAEQTNQKKHPTKDSKPSATLFKGEVDVSKDGDAKKHGTRLGLEVKKSENFSEWYSQVIKKSEMIEYYDVSGCYILRPWSYSIWDIIKNFFDGEIKKLGVENTYFPIFVSKSALEREKTHIEDFAPEVAWVTRSGQSELAEPIAIRPTSETVMYPTYAKWIQSHRDLPLQLNQWNNVVRWEFKQPQPFIRTREFLWQEGHTAFATRQEAVDEVHQILELYRRVYEELLAVPVICGKKTEKEKFAGADFTTTIEGYIPGSGRGIQAATSHHLGQNFSRMFDIGFEHPITGEREFVHQNSWGLTTRTIGVLTMVHGDDQGLVLPPRVACLQVVVVPCGLTVKLSDKDREDLLAHCRDFVVSLKDADIRCKADLRDNYSPGWKFNHWELKGVPVRIEIGPRDIKQRQFVAIRRDTGGRIIAKQDEHAIEWLNGLLEDIQASMFANAKAVRDANIAIATDWDDFLKHLNDKKLVQAPYCGICEDKIKKDSAIHDDSSEVGQALMGAKALCIPFDKPAELEDGIRCVHPSCELEAKSYTLFGRSY